MTLRRRLLVVLLIVLAAAAIVVLLAKTRLLPDRYNPLAPIDLTVAPNVITDAKLWLMRGDAKACIAALQHAGASVKSMPPRADRRGCERQGTVEISRLSHARLDPEEMNCDVALRLYLLERHDLQPLAKQHFGSEIDRILHFGSYSCRTIRGKARMSQHATANAFDISGFRLANGRTVSLLKDWNAGGDASRFLRDVRTSACLLFNLVLSPDYNADHADHFHVDMGWYMSCR